MTALLAADGLVTFLPAEAVAALADSHQLEVFFPSGKHYPLEDVRVVGAGLYRLRGTVPGIRRVRGFAPQPGRTAMTIDADEVVPILVVPYTPPPYLEADR